MMSYPESKYEFTRIIEHKHFEFGEQPSIITKEYPDDWSIGKESVTKKIKKYMIDF